MQICIADANCVQNLWRLNKSDASWLKGLVTLTIPDIVEDELIGRARDGGGRKDAEPARRSLPGKSALTLFQEFGVLDRKAWELSYAHLYEMQRLKRTYQASGKWTGLGAGELAVIVVAKEERSFPVKVITDDACARKAAIFELGQAAVLGVLDLVWMAAQQGRIDRTWIEIGANHLAKNFSVADSWPKLISEYADKAGLNW